MLYYRKLFAIAPVLALGLSGAVVAAALAASEAPAASRTAPRNYVVGIAIFPDALPLDFVGPTCLFEGISTTRLNAIESPLLLDSTPAENRTQATFETVHIAETKKPVKCSLGTTIAPQVTFEEVIKAQKGGNCKRKGAGSPGDKVKAKKLDILLIPGGLGASPLAASDKLKAFASWGAENVETVLTVCTGSWLLASTGALNGKKATTNKQAYKMAVDWTANQTNIDVEWISHARWVHEADSKVWTSSGVSAGMDMTSAFIDQVAGPAGGLEARAFCEYTANPEGTDPWTDLLGL